MSTIVALATPPGEGALHVIRLSGADAFPIINSISVDPVEKTVDRLQVTFIRSRSGSLIDQVVISKYYSPHSYTGEDCIEISCHGNGLISKLIIDELIKSGATYAQRGEFTKRAFLNNKIDLNQALHIGNLFKSRNEADIYSSIQEIRGLTSNLIRRHLDTLMNLICECEVNIDYPPDIETENSFAADVQKKIERLYSELNDLLVRSRSQKLSNYRVVFIGNSNAGKSSLVNHLIGKDRIIVSDRAGTTTDSIEVDFLWRGFLLTLVDTAGLDDIQDLDKYEFARKSKEEIDNSDLLVHLSSADSNSTLSMDFWRGLIGSKECIYVLTKNDLMDGAVKPPNSISVKNSDMKYLFDELERFLSRNYSPVGVKSAENINHLSNCCEELKRSLEPGLPLDLISTHLTSAHEHLSSIIRTSVSNTDRINRMFDGFCVGK